MSFQILDLNNKPISINELDKQAAIFWNKEIHPKEYATPLVIPEGLSLRERLNFINTNWFDKIGWIISYNQCNSWEEVITNLFKFFEEKGCDRKEVLENCPEIEKHHALITHWWSLGHKPMFVD